MWLRVLPDVFSQSCSAREFRFTFISSVYGIDRASFSFTWRISSTEIIPIVFACFQEPPLQVKQFRSIPLLSNYLIGSTSPTTPYVVKCVSRIFRRTNLETLLCAFSPYFMETWVISRTSCEKKIDRGALISEVTQVDVDTKARSSIDDNNREIKEENFDVELWI